MNRYIDETYELENIRFPENKKSNNSSSFSGDNNDGSMTSEVGEGLTGGSFDYSIIMNAVNTGY